jgi:IS30 family transposase
MSKLIPGNHTHLTLEDRQYIEEALNHHASFRDISKYLCKDPSTISKEVFHNRIVNTFHKGSFINPHNFCIHRFNCKKMNVCEKIIICDVYCKSCLRCNSVCSRFEKEECKQIEKAPFVCNGCDKPRHRCSIQTKYEYNAKAADRMYRERLRDSRSGINLSRQELSNLDAIVKPLIIQGQSPYMIITNHPELNISVKTLYNYIDQGALMTRSIDLKRKVKFKPRKCHKTQITNREVFIGRTYRDFINNHIDEMDYWEMDTVKSARGSLKCILTLYFPQCELLIARLMNRCTPGAVKLEFTAIQHALGDEFEFAYVFNAILTDRGVEFGDPDALEKTNGEYSRTSIYYCDPMRSNQKAGIENVHTMLRMILPKGTVFENLTQWDVRKCADHVNNAPRLNLGGNTPYELAIDTFGEELVKKLQLRYVAPDEVTLSPKLLKK